MLIETYGRVYLKRRQQNTDRVREFWANVLEMFVGFHRAIVAVFLPQNTGAGRSAIANHLTRNFTSSAISAA